MKTPWNGCFGNRNLSSGIRSALVVLFVLFSMTATVPVGRVPGMLEFVRALLCLFQSWSLPLGLCFFLLAVFALSLRAKSAFCATFHDSTPSGNSKQPSGDFPLSNSPIGTTEIVSLNDLIALQVDKFRSMAGSDTDFTFQSSRHLFTVCVDSEEIRQAMNLMCKTLLQSQQEFGRMVIRTQNVAIEQGYCDMNPWARAGCYVLLTVSDLDSDDSRRKWGDICSMDTPCPQFSDEQLMRQMKSALDVVSDHGGFMRIRGKASDGVELGLYLPISEALDGDITQFVQRAKAQSAGLILLAEDEDFIRELTVKFLKKAGYYVLAAHDGLEARRLFEKYSHHIDLLLLDVVMPRADGHSVYLHAKGIRPDVPILFCTGFGLNSIETRFIADEHLNVILKPYTSALLLNKISEVLGGKAQ